MYRRFLKRPLDLFLSLSLLCLLFPLLGVMTLWLWCERRGKNVFFLQDRPGKDGRLFRIIKFKTMTDRCDAAGVLLPDSERITALGAFLRATSLDELPQLWNVVRGDMSLVGPRPLLPAYMSLYSSVQARRHEVRPGITGWAQCHGRNALSWDDKFRLDVWYVDLLTFLTDLKVFFLTLRAVFRREGIAADGTATMEPFRGNDK